MYETESLWGIVDDVTLPSDSVGIGVCVNERESRFQVLMSLLDDEALPDQINAFIQLDPETAMNIAAKLMSAATEAGQMQAGIEASDDPEREMAEWITRFKAGLN
jgi:hypothetical protein